MTDEETFTIHDLPREERPRERLLKLGVEALSVQELLALVIGRGTAGRSALTVAQDLLRTFGNLQRMSNATVEELSAVKGIGPAKAAQLKASFGLGRRQDLEADPLVSFNIRNPEALVRAVRAGIEDRAKEHFKLVLLDTRNRITRIALISVGTLTASLVHPREVFRKAISHAASSVILVHNHPSGDPAPSDDDLALTRRLVEAGRLLGIEVLDHIVIGKKQFVSLKARGLM